MPGDVLEVRILSVGVWLPRKILFGSGIEIPTEPFWAIVGLAPPPIYGRVPSPAPSFHGGNFEGEIEVILHKNRHLGWPRAETPTHYMTMGLDRDLDVASELATREMVDFLVAEKGLTRDDAYLLCTLAMDLVITQVVDGTKCVHALLPKNIFPG